VRLRRAAPALALLALLTSCPGRESARPRPSGSTIEQGHPGGTLRVLLAEDVDAIDPQRAASPASFGLVRAMHRGLMAFASAPEDGSRVVPDLADGEPAVSADRRRYEFRLRDDVSFGPPASRPVTSADVKAGLERIFRVRSPLAGSFRAIAGAAQMAAGRATGLSGVTTPDERTVVITLVRPANDLLELLALPAASAVPPGLAPTAKPGQISGAGPYRLASDDGYVPESSIHLVRNDAWKPSSDAVRDAWVDEIRFQIGLSQAEIAKRIADGKADLAGDEPPAGAAPPRLESDRLVRSPNGCLRYLFLNTRVSPFNSHRVRKAVAAAIDRNAVALAYNGAARTAGTILPPTVAGNDPAATAPVPNPGAARSLLASAGFPRGFSARLVVGDEPIDSPQSGAVRAALARAGIRVSIARIPIASLYEDHYEVASARTPMGIATWCGDWPGLGGRGMLQPLFDGRRIPPRGSTDYSGIDDAELDRAMDAAGIAERAAAPGAWRNADAFASDLAAVIPLAHLDSVSPLGPQVRGFVPHPFFVRGDFTSLWLGDR
jgi:peptide/nickel transport system substrate-binding protein